MPSTPMYGLHIVRQDTRWFIVNNTETNQQPNIANWAIVGDLSGYPDEATAKRVRKLMYKHEAENGLQTFTIDGRNWRDPCSDEAEESPQAPSKD